MIRNSTARNSLYAWHGGQGSAFYQAASAGLIASRVKLRQELDACLTLSPSAKDKRELEKLKEWLEPRLAKPSDFVMDSVPYIVLPWGPETPR